INLLVFSYNEEAPQPVSLAKLALVAARDDSLRQPLDVGADIAWAREPDAVAVTGDVLEGASELADAVWAAHHERVERDRADERLALGLGEHLVELVDDQVGELGRAVVVPDDPARVVDLD